MKITKSRKHHIQMSKYEYIEIYAQVEDEFGGEPSDVEMATIVLDGALDIVTAPDLDDASRMTDNDDSYVHPYLEDLNKRSISGTHR